MTMPDLAIELTEHGQELSLTRPRSSGENTLAAATALGQP